MFTVCRNGVVVPVLYAGQRIMVRMGLYDKIRAGKLRIASVPLTAPKCVGLLGLFVALFISACQQGGSVAEKTLAAPARYSEGLGIEWFDGPVEQAFAQARAQRKPLFVYWGAKWCPPCNQLKANLFPRPDFIEQTRRFVAVNVDGDDPDAQRWAEHFGAMGYPTLIVFDPQGNEITRLSSGMELERYARVLATSASGRSLQELVLQATTDASLLTTEEWERLAWYPWAVDEDRTMLATERLALFELLRESNPPTDILQRRVELVWWLEREFQQQLDLLSEAEVHAGRALLLEVLGDPAEAKSSLVDLQYGAIPMIAALTEAGSAQRDLLLRALDKAMDTAWEDTSLSAKARVLTVRVLIRSARLASPGSALPEDLKMTVRKRLQSIAQQATTPHQRQSVLFYVGWYLHEIGDDEEAIATLEKEIATSIAPYYYMGYLAELEKERGNTELALQWSGRAFAAASGGATRMQWGVEHLQNLIALRPADEKAVWGVLNELRRVAAESPGSLYQRTRVRLERVQGPLQNWAAAAPERKDFLRQWRDEWLPVCDALQDATPAAQTCRNFLTAVEA